MARWLLLLALSANFPDGVEATCEYELGSCRWEEVVLYCRDACACRDSEDCWPGQSCIADECEWPTATVPPQPASALVDGASSDNGCQLTGKPAGWSLFFPVGLCVLLLARSRIRGHRSRQGLGRRGTHSHRGWGKRPRICDHSIASAELVRTWRSSRQHPRSCLW